MAASGGRDSTALLHVAARVGARFGIEVHALHVHHGLHPDAGRWLERLRRQCRRWRAAGLPLHFHCLRLAETPAAGDSVEAWARRERYRCLGTMAADAGIGLVLLAHHRRDQAETVLLQLLRGAGPAGLSAMPRRVVRDGITWARPWLDVPRASIEQYLRRHRLRPVDDSSNADPRFARSRLRTRLWPALEGAFAQLEPSLVLAAARAQEAAACLSELAAVDLGRCEAPDGGLEVARWLELSPARRANTLRGWLARLLPAGVPESLVRRLLSEVPGASTARWPAGAGELRLHDGVLRCFERSACLSVPVAASACVRIDLGRPGRVALPDWGGQLEMRAVQQGGIDMRRLSGCELRPRVGGERFQLRVGGVPRSLKKQYQALRVSSWQRHGPLIYDGDELLFVPGLGVDARQRAEEGVPQLLPRWLAAVEAG